MKRLLAVVFCLLLSVPAFCATDSDKANVDYTARVKAQLGEMTITIIQQQATIEALGKELAQAKHDAEACKPKK